MFRFPRRLSFQLTVSLAVALLLVMASIAVVSLRYQEAKLVEQSQRELLTTTQNVGLAVSLLLESRSHAIEEFAEHLSAQPNTDMSLSTFNDISSLTMRTHGFDALWFFSETGELLATARQGTTSLSDVAYARLVEASANEHFLPEVLAQRAFWLSEPFIEPITERLVVAFATPLLTAHQENVQGVIVGTLAISSSPLFQRVSAYRVFDSGFIAIASPQLNVIFHPAYPNELRRLPQDQQQLIRDYLSSANEASVIADSRGERWLQSFYRLSDSHWIVSVSVPAKEVLVSIERFKTVQLQTGVIATLGALLLIAFIVRLRLRVFKQLAKQVQEVRSGRSMALELTNLDEIDLLLRRFNHLIQENETSRQEAKQRQAYLDLVLSTSSVGHFMANSRGFIEYVNDTLVAITGYSREQLENGALAENIVDSEEKSIKARWVEALEQQRESQIEFKFKHAQNKEIWLRIHSKPVFDHGICLGHVGTVSDVTEENTRIEDLRSKAYQDELTGLMNRRGIEQVMHNAWHEAQLFNRDLVFLALDLDNFKAVNDEFGHEAGDWLLSQVAQALEKTVRDTDWVGRLGGDEFIAVLPGCPKERATRIAQSIVDAIGTISAQKDLPPVTVSVGVALLRKDDQSELDMLRRADKAAYQAKNAGRNQWALASE